LKAKASGGLELAQGSDATINPDYVQLLASHDETFTHENSQRGSVTWSGALADAYDRNTSTYRQMQIYASGDGKVVGSLTHEHQWTTPRKIKNVIAKLETNHKVGNYAGTDLRAKVSLLIGDAWTDVYSSTLTGGYGSNAFYTWTHNVSVTTGWEDVKGIRVYLYGDVYSYEGEREQYLRLRMYDVRAEEVYEAISFRLVRKLLGKMKDWNASIDDDSLTSGSWTSPAMQINAQELKLLEWNQTLTSSDAIEFYTRTGATQVTCEAAEWSTTALTNPNGSQISSAGNVWFQYKIEFDATDTTVSNPRVFFTNGYVTRYSFSRGSTIAETTVNFIYEIGFRNFDAPLSDKFFKKIGTVHEGTLGEVVFTWETEHATNSFTIPMTTYPKRWESYFHDTAIGREANFKITKTDLHPFRLSEVKGIYTEYPQVL